MNKQKILKFSAVSALSTTVFCGFSSYLPSAAHAATTSASSWSAYQNEAPSGMNEADHANITVTSPTITSDMVGKTIVVSTTGKTGVAITDPDSVHFHYNKNNVWYGEKNQSAPIVNGATTGLKMPITSDMTGSTIQLYGELEIPDTSVGAVQINAQVVIGSGVWKTSTSFTTPKVAAMSQRSPLMWVDMGGNNPTDDQIAQIAGHYQTVILGSYMTSVAEKLRALDPDVKILAYLDLASVRSFDGNNAISSGVSYTDAENNGWITKDIHGNPMEWNHYKGQFQANVWNADYQKAWTERALQLANSSVWDGIFADNDMRTLAYYNTTPIAGTNDQNGTDALVTSGLDSLVKQAGSALKANGKLFVPNIGESRLRPDTYASHSAYGGGFEEMFMSWDQENKPTIWNWGDGGWSTLENEVANNPNRNLDLTQATKGDMRTMLYGYASFLLAEKSGDTWGVNDGEVVPVLPQETSMNIGTPLGAMTSIGNGGFQRYFSHGWTAVNPSNTDTITINVPNGSTDMNGNIAMSTVTLQPMSGIVLHR